MNHEFRKRVLGPALIPLGALGFIGALVFGFSRILLAVPKDGSVVVGVLMAGCILFAAGAVAKAGKIKPAQRAALLGFGALVIGGGVAAAASLHTRPVEKHLEVAATLTAQSIAYDTKELDLPADEPFILEFVNKDPVPHNVAIYNDEAAAAAQDPATTRFKGEIFAGPATRQYQVEKGIPAGVYFFRCDVHPVMNGIARVGGATGAAPGGAASPSPAPTGTGPTPTPTGTAPTSAPGGEVTVIELVAKNLAFDKNELTFPAGKPVVIEFDNQDVGQPHNFALYTDSSYAAALFKPNGFVTGPGTTRYELPPLQPGTYYFRCEAHPIPAMSGTVIVR